MHGKSHEQLNVRLPRFVYQPVTLLVTAAAARSVSFDFGRVKHTQHTYTHGDDEGKEKNWRKMRIGKATREDREKKMMRKLKIFLAIDQLEGAKGKKTFVSSAQF